jgi:hypothetical protein
VHPSGPLAPVRRYDNPEAVIELKLSEDTHLRLFATRFCGGLHDGADEPCQQISDVKAVVYTRHRVVIR